MRQHQPSRQDLKEWYALMEEANNQPTFTPEHLQFLARRRDQFLAKLSK